MNDQHLYIHLHWRWSDGSVRRVSAQTRYGGGDDYSTMTYALLEKLKTTPDLLKDFDNLERVIFYSSTSKPYVLPAALLLWLTGHKPEPANKDPNWIR